MTSWKTVYGFFTMPVFAATASVLLYFALQKWSKFSKSTNIKAAVGFFAVQPLYATLYVRLYDAFKHSVGKIRHMLWSVFKRRQYKEFVSEKEAVQREIVEVIDKIGPEVVGEF